MIGLDTLGDLLEEVTVRDVRLEDYERDDTAQQWRTAIALADPLGERTYTIYFEEIADENTSFPTTVTVGCVISHEPSFGTDPTGDFAILAAVNDANAEPGVKFRVARLNDGSGEIVCEADLGERLATPDALSEQLDRVLDAVEARANLISAAVG